MITYEEAEERREEGISRAEEGASDGWKEAALEFIYDYCKTHEEVFVDDLWDAGLPETRDNRALGPLMRQAARVGFMEKTGSYRPSKKSNLSAKPVWRSNLIG